MNKVLRFLFSCAVLFSNYLNVYSQPDTAQVIVPNRVNAFEQQGKPYVILISADGFRYDYTTKYKAKQLNKLAARGVRADALIPAFPSVTFPNHYTIVTGMYPAHHGLVGNNIYDIKTNSRYTLKNLKAVRDASWYGGVPIWTLAEQQQLLSASFYWPGSEAPIGGLYPSYYYPYNEKISIARRIQKVVEWLSLPAEKRPHLINFYLPEVDHAGHLFGPDAPETGRAVHFVDSAIYALTTAVKKTGLPVNFVFVSDHGMLNIDNEKPLKLPFNIDTSQVVIANNGTLVNIHVKDKKNITRIYKSIAANDEYFSVYLKKTLPSTYHYGKKNDRFNRVGDIVLVANAPYYFANNKPHPGAHGYDPYETPEMNATFIAWGPSFKQGKIIPAFENIHIYPLLAKLLDLRYQHTIDGDDRVAQETLKH
ncbi:alkaline phosphatase family protein [Olivibacter sp. SDN3]|uniref:alkaline phosphatase family protein n=1 Tax=Olivibacter sp. SDN3 TaxID=2764720 RepID=UPI001650E76A|nr:ectonucleotide pyrophosphatase/phosphodiesterase [Olivibacter sp. SDN3]QNL48635.1 alkaline phosphatase family protein [Olivibacter sp. SDN3]